MNFFYYFLFQIFNFFKIFFQTQGESDRLEIYTEDPFGGLSLDSEITGEYDKIDVRLR